MKKNLLLFAISVMVSSMLFAGSSVEDFHQGGLYHGFRLKDKKFIPEVNSECLYFLHEQSGARLLKIAADDPNKMFNIAFKTIPSNSTGVPHILEHAVLNGSRNFPVKSPFFVLLRGSLNTFLNAMVRKEYTTYPVASLNHKDYFNLMHVYLDAVFFPLIYENPRIFLQEGWHYELKDPEGEITMGGVVLNEMKGLYSHPIWGSEYYVNQALFPDNPYGFCSGGNPEVIPDLSYEEFLEFHRVHYHPSNSYITLYGNADLNAELSFIHQNYLSEFTASDARVSIELQKPLEAMQEIQKPYSVAAGSPVKDQSYLSLSFVAGEGADQDLLMALRVLVDALVNHQSAPVRLALQQASLGKDVQGSVEEGLQNVVNIRVEGANAHEKDLFRDIVFQSMKAVCEQGFEKEILEGVINRREFGLREGNTVHKGLNYTMRSLRAWLHRDDPFAGLQYESSLDYIKQALNSSLLEDLLQQHLVDNPHSVLMVLYPEPGREAVLAERERQRLADYKQSLSPEQIQTLVQQTHDLRVHQSTPDSPENLATIPMLSLQDISTDSQWFPLKQKTVQQVPVLHYDAFTNDILYSQLYFDMRVLPTELIPYGRLLAEIFRQMGTTEKSFGQLDNALNINTGGFEATVEMFRQNQSEDDFLPMFIVGGKATLEKADVFYSLMQEMIHQLDFQNKDRLKTVLSRHQAATRSIVENAGFYIAWRRFNSYLSLRGVIEEMVNGLTYYQFITHLTDKFDEHYDEIVRNLSQTASLLFTRDNTRVQLTVDANGYETTLPGLSQLISSLPQREPLIQAWVIELLPANEAMLTASKVQYVIQGYNFRKLGYQYDGKMKVLNQILSMYLTNVIREMGGAYGGFVYLDPSGIIYFGSFRDPHLKETLDNYQAGLQFLQSFNAPENEMTRFIIGVISTLDRPLTVSAQGSLAMRNHLEGISLSQLQEERAAVLSTTAADIRNMSEMIGSVLAKNVFCVFGNEEKIRQHEELFSTMLNVP
jgi:presequence protease